MDVLVAHHVEPVVRVGLVGSGAGRGEGDHVAGGGGDGPELGHAGDADGKARLIGHDVDLRLVGRAVLEEGGEFVGQCFERAGHVAGQDLVDAGAEADDEVVGLDRLVLTQQLFHEAQLVVDPQVERVETGGVSQLEAGGVEVAGLHEQQAQLEPGGGPIGRAVDGAAEQVLGQAVLPVGRQRPADGEQGQGRAHRVGPVAGDGVVEVLERGLQRWVVVGQCFDGGGEGEDRPALREGLLERAEGGAGRGDVALLEVAADFQLGGEGVVGADAAEAVGDLPGQVEVVAVDRKPAEAVPRPAGVGVEGEGLLEGERGLGAVVLGHQQRRLGGVGRPVQRVEFLRHPAEHAQGPAVVLRRPTLEVGEHHDGLGGGGEFRGVVGRLVLETLTQRRKQGDGLGRPTQLIQGPGAEQRRGDGVVFVQQVQSHSGFPAEQRGLGGERSGRGGGTQGGVVDLVAGPGEGGGFLRVGRGEAVPPAVKQPHISAGGVARRQGVEDALQRRRSGRVLERLLRVGLRDLADVLSEGWRGEPKQQDN